MSGAILQKTQGSGDYTGKVQRFHVDSAHSTLLALGDFVVLTGTAHTDGVAEVDAAVGTEGTPGLLTGIIVGFEPNYEDLEAKGLAASTGGYVFVQTDPYALFEIEIATTALTVADVGMNFDITATAATSSGNLVSSNMVLDGSTALAATGQIRCVALVEETGETLGAIGQKALCRINESTEKGIVGVDS
jgi:hypothetical protein